MSDTIIITKTEYLKLNMDSEVLSRLEGGGVDDWEWYSESINAIEHQDLDEYEDDLRKRLELD